MDTSTSSFVPSSSTHVQNNHRDRRTGRPRLRDRPIALDNESSNAARRRRYTNQVHYVGFTDGAAHVSTSVPYAQSSLLPNHSLSRSNTNQNANTQSHRLSYWDCGDANIVCIHCEAMLWYAEHTVKTYCPSDPKFSICCCEGKVRLPFLQHAPHPLNRLLCSNDDPRCKVFKENIKLINAMFAFTSTGGKVCTEVNDGHGPYTFRLNGHNHHRIGTLLPTHTDGRPRFAQLYIYDTGNEINNRFYALSHCVPRTSDKCIISSLVRDLVVMLDRTNSLVQAFRMARERFTDASMQPVRLRLIGTRNRDGRQYNLPTAHEVAALIPGDGNPTDSRDILIEERGNGNVKRISELHPSFMALQYPLLFPYGEDGFHINIPLSNVDTSSRRKYVSLREYYCYRLQIRLNEGRTLLNAGRLFHTFVVDAYTAVLEHDLDWYKRNQKTIRSDLYNGLQDRISDGEVQCESIGRRVILPSSFTGGPRHMIQQYQDAMAICRWAGTPDLFVTITSNPKWPEIERHVQQYTHGHQTSDRPDIIARVFKIKLNELLKDIKKKNYFGRTKAVIYTIEFQKRGLPHCHALVFLHPADKIKTPEQIDRLISADLPSERHDPCGFASVRVHMMHGPCGQFNPSSPCMINGRCRFGFPKNYAEQTFITNEGWPSYKRPNNSRSVAIGSHGIKLDNRFVVPHNRDLLVKYGCHINVEWCNQGMLVKYLFNYINKGSDHATVRLEVNGNDRTPFTSLLHNENEIEEYLNCRYISASEACWKLFAFELHYRDVSVERLPFHEEGCHRVYFHDNDQLADIAQRTTSAMSKFTQWMRANQEYPTGRSLTYADYPTRFTWHGKDKEWRPRKNAFNTIGRVYYVSPNTGERYYLRMLLNVVRGPTSFEDIRTVDGIVHPTYMSACKALHLLGDDVEWFEAIRDASHWQLGYQLRELFVTILLFCTLSDPAKLFADCYPYLSEDVGYNQRRILQNDDIVFTDAEVLNYTLLELDKLLAANNKSLSDFPNLPQLDHRLLNIGTNRFIAVELAYNVIDESARYDALHSALNNRQKEVYDEIMNLVDDGTGGLFFVLGSGGTGKTYLWKTLIARLRSRRKIVLSVASSGIASLLLPGGRTAHSRFGIPMDLDKDSCCAIDAGSHLADLINVASLIIWDEAPLQHRYAFEAVDRTLRDVCRPFIANADQKVFGGKVVVLGGDFRQILPVIEQGSRSEIVSSVVNRSSAIWASCRVFSLTTNMRLHDASISGEDRMNMHRFSQWLLDMGSGRLNAVSLDGEDERTWITIPDDLLIHVVEEPVKIVVSSTFPDIGLRYNDICYLKERCILCPTNDEVDLINRHVLDSMPGEMHELLSADEICSSTTNIDEMRLIYPPEFLNTLQFSGIPNHVLELKVGAPVILLRNINLQRGLCNGTRLVVTQITRRVIEAEIISGSNVGEKVFIGRIDMTPTNTRWPFHLKRRQFPLKVCFAMTINRSQGQTFNHVCVYLVKPIFAHGQLYVASSRVTSRSGLRFYIDNNGRCPNNLTKNIVYKEVFYNLPQVHADDLF